MPVVPVSSGSGMSREQEIANMKLKSVGSTEVNEKPKELSMHEQIKSVQLKKVVKDPNQGNKLITGNERNYLQNALADAIKMRRYNLHQYDDSDDEEEEDDWD